MTIAFRHTRPACLEVHPDSTVTGTDGHRRAVLAVGGLYHDTQSDDERDTVAAAGAALVAGLLPGQELQLLVCSNPLDRDALLAQVAAETAACPPALGAYRTGAHAWWAVELRDRHQPRRDFYGKRQNSEHRLFITYDLLQSSGQEQRDLNAHPCTFVLSILFCGPLF